MRKFDVQIALEGVREAREKWAAAKREFESGVDFVMSRLLHEAAANFMSPEEVARHSGLTSQQVRDRIRTVGLDPRKGKRLLAKHAAEALAENSALLGIEPHEMDLTSPLAYLPMGSELKQQLTDARVHRVTELPEDDEDAAFYEEHYSDWTVHALPLTVYVPTKSRNREEAVALVREILDEAAFGIRVEVFGNRIACPRCNESVYCGNCGFPE